MIVKLIENSSNVISFDRSAFIYQIKTIEKQYTKYEKNTKQNNFVLNKSNKF